MKFSTSTVAMCLATSSFLTASNAFTTPHFGRGGSHLSMLQENKFDVVMKTKTNKNLGYDDQTGRFFEITPTIKPTTSSLTNTKSSENDLHEKIETHIIAEEIESIQAATDENQANSIIDIPPMPDARFTGMNVTGEINGVKMTSSEKSLKRKAEMEEKRKQDVIVEQTAAALSEPKKKSSLADQITNSGAVSAAAMATAAVNAAVSMKTLTAPSVEKSYISLESSKETDLDGLPLTYDKDLIEIYWRKERGALNQRWSYFVGKAVPFLTKLVTLFISEGEINERHIPGLSKQARMDLQDLGPTFIKAGQMMSVRPDVLPQATLDELTKLQDSVVPFVSQHMLVSMF